MLWEETRKPEEFVVPDDVVDLAFGIACRCLPVDHAYALSQALMQALPWFAHEEGAGMHPILVADSGNGWFRPENPTDLLHPSRRTKLVLRVPRHRVDDAHQLTGRTLDVAGHAVKVDKANVRPLVAITTVFAHHIVSAADQDETAFMQETLRRLHDMGVKPKKMLCGKEAVISTPDAPVRTRSLMLAELAVEESVLLQQRGMGPLRQLGCGLFIPHKDIGEVKQKTG